MNLLKSFWVGALSLGFAACAASGEGPVDADALEIVPTASTASPSSTATPADSGAKTEPAPANTCPLFCAPKDGICTRPKIADAKLAHITCGQYSRGDFRGLESEACPAECCPALTKDGADRDADGIPDVDDECPDAPEDRDGYADWDGCAEMDNDGDGFDDVKDKCCYVAEDVDGYEDLDGCPEP